MFKQNHGKAEAFRLPLLYDPNDAGYRSQVTDMQISAFKGEPSFLIQVFVSLGHSRRVVVHDETFSSIINVLEIIQTIDA